jgi:hypothetical protein
MENGMKKRLKISNEKFNTLDFDRIICVGATPEICIANHCDLRDTRSCSLEKIRETCSLSERIF